MRKVLERRLKWLTPMCSMQRRRMDSHLVELQQHRILRLSSNNVSKLSVTRSGRLCSKCVKTFSECKMYGYQQLKTWQTVKSTSLMAMLISCWSASHRPRMCTKSHLSIRQRLSLASTPWSKSFLTHLSSVQTSFGCQEIQLSLLSWPPCYFAWVAIAKLWLTFSVNGRTLCSQSATLAVSCRPNLRLSAKTTSKSSRKSLTYTADKSQLSASRPWRLLRRFTRVRFFSKCWPLTLKTP